MFNPEREKDKIARAATYVSAIIAIAIVAIAIISFNGGISVGASNHFGQLPVVRRLIDPSYLPADFSIELRLYHHRVFSYLIAGLTLLIGEDNALITLGIAGMGLLAFSLWRLCRTAGLSLPGYLAAGIALATNLLWVGRGLELNHFAGDAAIMPPTFAHAFVLLALAAVIREKFYRAAFFAGLAALFHLQIGLICGAALAPIYVWNRARLGLRGLVVSAACFLIAAAAGLVDLIELLRSGVAGGSSEPYTRQFYIDFRHPHHFELLSVTAAISIIIYAVIQILAVRRDPGTGKSDRAATTMAAVSVSLVVYALFHFADYYLIRDDRLATIQFIRLSPLISVTGFVSALVWLRGRISAAGFTIASVAIVLLALLWGAWQVRYYEREFLPGIARYADKTSTWVRVCQWVGANGPKDALYITPPGNNGFTSLSNRSTIADFKNNPDGGRKMAEWFDRLKDLSGGRLPEGRGFDNRDLLNEAYDGMSAEQLQAISDKYKAEYAIVSSRKKFPFETVYRNQRYQVLRISGEVR